MGALETIGVAAAGSAITLALSNLGRLLNARHDIFLHDRQVKDLNREIGQWVADDDVRLKRELRAIRNDLNARNLFYSGEYGYQVGLAKERAVQMYRDQATSARRSVDSIGDRETWMHSLWRWVLRRPQPAFTAPATVKPVIDAWLSAPTKHLSQTDIPIPIADPGDRTITTTVGQLNVDDYA
jgi:hypothetical protein